MGERSRITDRQRWAAGVIVALAGAVFLASGAVSDRASPVAPIPTVNLNTASRAELQMLPGIGPAIAGRIVADRETRGVFRTVDDLARVSGIGERTVRGLRDFAIVDD